MIIDSHTHVSVRCEADWDLDSSAATMKYCFQRNLRGRTSRCGGWPTIRWWPMAGRRCGTSTG